MNALITFLLAALLTSPSVLAAQEHEHEHEHSQDQEHASDADHAENTDCVREAEAHGHEDEHDHEDDHEDEHDHDDGDNDEHDHQENKSSCITSDIAAQTNIITAHSGAQTLHPSITVYGEFNAGAEQISHLRARFEGLIKNVQGRVGDKVTAGDLLAEVESNDSLKLYPVKAPISGQIVERHANKGEVTRDQVLFSIANFDTLWAELRIFPSQHAQVKAGQKVKLRLDGDSIDGVIEHIVPVINQPYAIARLNIANAPNNTSSPNDNNTHTPNHKTQIMPGQWLEARIEVAELPVALAVTKTALQTMSAEGAAEAQTGVFIKQGNHYIFTPLSLGRSDEHYVEVLAGLAANTEYVSQNSYLVKADIEKSTAEHEH